MLTTDPWICGIKHVNCCSRWTIRKRLDDCFEKKHCSSNSDINTCWQEQVFMSELELQCFFSASEDPPSEIAGQLQT
ncbi:hypothetical protein DPMN_122284 [Dreissena polymorpha]|uniref:Uncharacterized protein n=1 Tax=Dreissena polymorpha TaxID=45954 RepID=A0A9D4GP36_DREPO|nr:hypothetical protein DPMN_122284 [Dreissena polymorpha]